MIPFYLGRIFKKSGASDDVYSKLGINEDNALGHTSIVQRYGNLIGFVKQFFLGVRNPIAFLARALGISPKCFFAGVCCGGLITLPVQVKTVIKYAFSLHAAKELVVLSFDMAPPASAMLVVAAAVTPVWKGHAKMHGVILSHCAENGCDPTSVAYIYKEESVQWYDRSCSSSTGN
ncbi:SNARE associated Golgi protein [Tanacetum coccineum]|uniref:SNARE associated Golgi protein n=1 Tax=Tanacetum coccineum TaxID=301880 RepID=A0ABQ5B3D0_9ASTR